MPHKNFYRGLLLLALAAPAGCQHGGAASSGIAAQFSASGGKSVDLALAVPGNWDRVCVLGPYSNDAAAAETLGIDWSAETLTSIKHNDGISLLVFVQGKSVISYVEHPRKLGDFTNLGGRCFPQTNAKFTQVGRPAKGWAGLFPVHEA
ncbi:MAG: hypothetical protein ABI843_15125 [Dokdonella sp.]